MKDFKYKKQVILGISITLFLCALSLLILFFVFSNRSTLVSSNNPNTNGDIVTELSLGNTIDVTDTSKEETPEVIVTDEKASEEELKKEKVTKKEVKKSTSPYYIKVNYGANTVTIYKKDSDGNYTVPYKAMVCSCGTYTPKSGTYKISSKYRWGKLIHDVYGQYATRIVGSILFHSVPYSSNTADTLLYNQYDKLGTTASAGCVRLTVRDAKWIYSNCPSGTMVEFYSNSNPGPLGKPSAQKISSVEECRNWDPTDTASGNPWHTYNPNKENVKDDNTTNNTITNNQIIDNSINDKPIVNESSNNIPSINNSTVNKPNDDKPNIDNTIVNEPSNNKPTVDNPTVDEPNNDIPSTDNPSISEPNNDTPTTDEPNNDESSTDNPTIDEPNNDEPTTDNSIVNGIV